MLDKLLEYAALNYIIINAKPRFDIEAVETRLEELDEELAAMPELKEKIKELSKKYQAEL